MVTNSELEILEGSSKQGSILIGNDEYDRLKKKAEEAEIFYDKLLRLQAEFENYKKFTERQKSEYLKFGTHRILKDLIKIYEDLKRALHDHNNSPLTQGLMLILNNLGALLEREGVTPILAEGEMFDPSTMECLLVEHDPSKPDGQVTEVLSEGFLLNEKILRPARVKINKIGDEK
ncbi:MAG: nucleotide exchange factor GrpE [Candidatus Helarchaeota archaeon]